MTKLNPNFALYKGKNNFDCFLLFRLHPLRVRKHPLDSVSGHPHRPRELRSQQPQHTEEGALQEEDVPQRRPLLDGRVN